MTVNSYNDMLDCESCIELSRLFTHVTGIPQVYEFSVG